jgi:hypothetical protein
MVRRENRGTYFCKPQSWGRIPASSTDQARTGGQTMRIYDMIRSLDEEELAALHKDLEGGGSQIHRIVQEYVQQKEEGNKICAGCNREIEHAEDSTMVLVFGPKGFRKKATFCAADCLQYFVCQLKKTKKGGRV